MPATSDSIFFLVAAEKPPLYSTIVSIPFADSRIVNSASVSRPVRNRCWLSEYSTADSLSWVCSVTTLSQTKEFCHEPVP